jgi:coenzyme F420-0:L-glutamate ligase/coenzyme F420-1:gamma-L-glutamate ligase
VTGGDVRLIPVAGLPEIRAGDPLAELLMDALARTGTPVRDGDVLVVTHKIVAKAEGALVHLATVTPSPFARAYAERWGKDPRHMEVVLQQSTRIVRMDRGVLICETHHGLVCANAGVDASNLEGDDIVCVLPSDPDASAAALVAAIAARTGARAAAIISDTFGRPWREGLTNVAIGVAGMKPILDYVGLRDPAGRELRVTALAIADELASAAELVMGKLARVPAALVRGYQYQAGEGAARELLRKPDMDLFR